VLRWVLRLAAVLPLLVVVAVIYAAVQVYQPFAGSPHGPKISVTIPAHAGAHQIGDLLAQKGIVASGFWFNIRAMLAGDRSKLLSGTYHLQAGMTYAAALTALLTPPPAAKTETITMTPGQRRIDFSKKLKAAGVPGDYYRSTRHSRLLDPRKYGAPAHTPSLEGFLFPDSYQLRVPVKLSKLIADQLKRFKQEFATVNMRYAASQHLSPYEVLIIASLVQAEAFDAHDMALVASVIYNRLHDGILLGFDSTTRYAVGNFTKPLTQSQLASPSPWNTRNHAGLPPTPIDNPDLQAIRAAAHPPATKDLYFVSKPCSNGLAFSSSYNQFLKDVAAFNATQSQNGAPPTHKCK
jgi:uncharacterized YceG family protein